MAMKSITKMRIEPACPRSSVATAGGTNPSPASPEVMGNCKAVDARPSEVARENGIANQQTLQARTFENALSSVMEHSEI
jgi:hypothetical protein